MKKIISKYNGYLTLLIILVSPLKLLIAESIQISETKVTGATIVNCGEIEANPSVAVQEEKQTKHGYVFVMDELETPVFKPGCPKILAKEGTRFGIQVQVDGSPDFTVVDTVTRVTHPLIRNPENNKEGTIDEWNSPMNIGYARFAGWQFDQPWELVPGKWKIEILYHDKVLTSKEFDVEITKENIEDKN